MITKPVSAYAVLAALFSGNFYSHMHASQAQSFYSTSSIASSSYGSSAHSLSINHKKRAQQLTRVLQADLDVDMLTESIPVQATVIMQKTGNTMLSHKEKAQMIAQRLQASLDGQASEQNSDGLCALAERYETAQKLTEAEACYLQAADNGDEQALYYLPEFYNKHRAEIPQALSKRLLWLRSIANPLGVDEALDSEACFKVGECYERGIGTTVDIAAAYTWYKMAADENYGIASYKLGSWYEYGIFVEANRCEAFRYYKLAADRWIEDPQWVARTCVKVAQCYEKGFGVMQNDQEADKYYSVAKRTGYKEVKKPETRG